MELDYEKDILNIMKLLAYHIQSFKYEYPEQAEKQEDFNGLPWIDINLSKKELEELGISIPRGDLLFSGVCQKQGMTPNNYRNSSSISLEVEEEYNSTAEERSFVSFPALFWIDSFIKDIENNTKKTENSELITKRFNEKNFITFNGLTGDFIYNNAEGRLSIKSSKYKLLRLLMRNENNKGTYNEISKVLFNEETYNKAKRAKALADVLDDLKRDLKILPNDGMNNLDCFVNVPLESYRLELPK